MKRIILAIALASIAWAQPTPAEFEWPDSSAVVRVNGEVIPAFWRDGRPMVQRAKTLHHFHVRTGPDDIDLAETARQQGYRATLQADGSIDLVKVVTTAPAAPDQSEPASRTVPSYSGSSGMVKVRNVRSKARKTASGSGGYTPNSSTPSASSSSSSSPTSGQVDPNAEYATPTQGTNGKAVYQGRNGQLYQVNGNGSSRNVTNYARERSTNRVITSPVRVSQPGQRGYQRIEASGPPGSGYPNAHQP